MRLRAPTVAGLRTGGLVNFRRSLAIAAALGFLSTASRAQNHTTGAHPAAGANNPIHQADGVATGYNNPLQQGIGFGNGYNNPLSQGVGFGTGYNDPLQQGAGFGSGYNNPLYQNGNGNLGGNPSLNTGRQFGGNNIQSNVAAGAIGANGVFPGYGLGYGVAAGSPWNSGYGYGGWNSNANSGFGFGGGFPNLGMPGLMNGNPGNPLIPDGLNPVGVGGLQGANRVNSTVSATLNGAMRGSKQATRSRSSRSSKRTTRRK